MAEAISVHLETAECHLSFCDSWEQDHLAAKSRGPVVRQSTAEEWPLNKQKDTMDGHLSATIVDGPKVNQSRHLFGSCV